MRCSPVVRALHLLIHAITQSANHVATAQRLSHADTCQAPQLMFTSDIRKGGKHMTSMTLTVALLLAPDGPVWAFLKLLISWDFHAQQLLKFDRNDAKKRRRKTAVLWTETPCRWARSEKNDHTWLELTEKAEADYRLKSIACSQKSKFVCRGRELESCLPQQQDSMKHKVHFF